MVEPPLFTFNQGIQSHSAELSGIAAKNACLKQLSLVQVLCKTYKRDPMFATSLLNLLQKLEDEIVKDRAKFEKSEEKKASYKQLARSINSQFLTKIEQERKDFDNVKLSMATVIQEQEATIESLKSELVNSQEQFGQQVTQLNIELENLKSIQSKELIQSTSQKNSRLIN